MKTDRGMSKHSKVEPIVRKPSEGRSYPMGRMSAIFKADLDETGSTISVSEWWLEPNTEGPHIHQHPESHVFYVIEGELAIYLEDRGWFRAVRGTYVYIPGGTEHGFENRSDDVAGFLAITTPGGFEKDLPGIVQYFDEHPLGDARGSKQEARAKT